MSDVPVDIGTKLWTTSLENPTWQTDVDKKCTTVIWCNISQTQYFMSKTYSYNILAYINVYE